MISTRTLEDYIKCADSLSKSFREHIPKAKGMVVKDSQVDFTTHSFVCSCYDSYLEAMSVSLSFHMAGVRSAMKVKIVDLSELIEDLSSLENRLAIQNDELERLTEKFSNKL